MPRNDNNAGNLFCIYAQDTRKCSMFHFPSIPVFFFNHTTSITTLKPKQKSCFFNDRLFDPAASHKNTNTYTPNKVPSTYRWYSMMMSRHVHIHNNAEISCIIITADRYMYAARSFLHVNVDVHVYGQDMPPPELSGLYNLHPWYLNTLFCSLISSRENSAFGHFTTATANHYNLAFFVPPDTHHCWVGRHFYTWPVVGIKP